MNHCLDIIVARCFFCLWGYRAAVSNFSNVHLCLVLFKRLLFKFEIILSGIRFTTWGTAASTMSGRLKVI